MDISVFGRFFDQKSQMQRVEFYVAIFVQNIPSHDSRTGFKSNWHDRKEKITRFEIKGQHFKPLVVFTKISKPILCTKTSLDYESLNIKFEMLKKL